MTTTTDTTADINNEPTLTTQPPHTPTPLEPLQARSLVGPVSERKPTPTPWVIRSYDNHTSISAGAGQSDQAVIATLSNNHKANAAFIVRAVNNHDKLVEALKIAMEAFDGLFQAIDNGTDASAEILEDDSLWPIAQLRAVLAELGE